MQETSKTTSETVTRFFKDWVLLRFFQNAYKISKLLSPGKYSQRFSLFAFRSSWLVESPPICSWTFPSRRPTVVSRLWMRHPDHSSPAKTSQTSAAVVHAPSPPTRCCVFVSSNFHPAEKKKQFFQLRRTEWLWWNVWGSRTCSTLKFSSSTWPLYISESFSSLSISDSRWAQCNSRSCFSHFWSGVSLLGR